MAALDAFGSVSPLQLLAGIAALAALGVALRRRWRPMRFVAIIDGDTFEAVDVRGRHRRLRLRAVDCPELDQPFGHAAQTFVQRWAGRRWVHVRLRGRDRYRRHLADVRRGRRDLATDLLRAGLAYPLAGASRLATWPARLLRRGVWGQVWPRRPWQSRSRRHAWMRRLLRRR